MESWEAISPLTPVTRTLLAPSTHKAARAICAARNGTCSRFWMLEEAIAMELV